MRAEVRNPHYSANGWNAASEGLSVVCSDVGGKCGQGIAVLRLLVCPPDACFAMTSSK